MTGPRITIRQTVAGLASTAVVAGLLVAAVRSASLGFERADRGFLALGVVARAELPSDVAMRVTVTNASSDPLVDGLRVEYTRGGAPVELSLQEIRIPANTSREIALVLEDACGLRLVVSLGAGMAARHTTVLVPCTGS